MIKVAGYGRVSTLDQATKGTSSGEQQEAIQRECEKMGHSLVEFYRDDGFSGRNDSRPGLKRLMEDAKAGKFQVVMFTKLDRLGRNLRDTKNIIHDLKKLSLDIYCVEQPEINKDGVYGDLTLNILSTFAEFEANMIKERTSCGRNLRWRKGESVIGSLPYGYIKNKINGKVEIDEEKVRVYEKIVSLYLDQNFSLKDIANKLTDEGIPTPSQKSIRWHATVVNDILKNAAYTGESFQNKFECELKHGRNGKQYYAASGLLKHKDQWIKVKYAPLITKERFNQIQARIESQKRKPKKHHIGNENSFMSENVLFCGYCGARIRKRVLPNGKACYCCYWWECAEKELKMCGREKCRLKYIDADVVDNDIFNEVVKVLSMPGDFVKHWYKDSNIEELQKKVDNLKKKDEELQYKLREGFRLIREAKNSGVKKIYEGVIKKDEELYASNRDNLSSAEKELDFLKSKIERLVEFEKLINGRAINSRSRGRFIDFLYDLPFQEKKRVLEAVINYSQGGKCFVRYVTAHNIGDDIDSIDDSKIHEPLMERDPYIECNFDIDVNKIEALVTGLNNRSLLNSVETRRAAGI